MDLMEFLTAHSTVVIMIMGLLGLLVGSFLNVVVYRLPLFLEQQARRDCAVLLDYAPWYEPNKLSLWQPCSFCVHCKQALPVRFNIPIVSYLFLKGKSHCCQQAITLRYPLIEFISCLLAIALAYHFPIGLKLTAAVLLVWFLLPLLFIDLEKQYLPDQLTLTLLWLGLLVNLFHTFISLSDAVLGSCVGYVFCYVMAWLFKTIRHKDVLGYGDFKLVAALGAWFGWQLLPPLIFIASALGVVFTLGFIFIKKTGYDRPIPFGPFLVVAALIVLMSS